MCKNIWINSAKTFTIESLDFHRSERCGGSQKCNSCSQGITFASLIMPICSHGQCWCHGQISNLHFTESKSRINHHVEIILQNLRQTWPTEKIFPFRISTESYSTSGDISGDKTGKLGENFKIEFLILSDETKTNKIFEAKVLCDCRIKEVVENLSTKIEYAPNSTFDHFAFIAHLL